MYPHNLCGRKYSWKDKIQIGAAIEDLETPQKTCLFREEIYLPVNQKWKSLTEKSLKR
jgi:hypothetical protein